MSYVIIALALSIAVAGLVLLINPAPLLTLLGKSIEKPGLQWLAIVMRLLLGALLVAHSHVSRFPLAIEILGWLSIFAAAVLIAIGHRNFVRLMTWAMSIAKPFAPVGGIAAVCFGTFLMYAFI